MAKGIYQREEALFLASGAIGVLNQFGEVTIAGSYRRDKQVVGDLDIVWVAGTLCSRADVKRALNLIGYTTSNTSYSDGFRIHKGDFQIDVFLATRETYGAVLVKATGPKEFNQVLERAWPAVFDVEASSEKEFITKVVAQFTPTGSYEWAMPVEKERLLKARVDDILAECLPPETRSAHNALSMVNYKVRLSFLDAGN